MTEIRGGSVGLRPPESHSIRCHLVAVSAFGHYLHLYLSYSQYTRLPFQAHVRQVRGLSDLKGEEHF